jgi:hypothetical protein
VVQNLIFRDGYAVNLDTLRINGIKSNGWHIYGLRYTSGDNSGYIPEKMKPELKHP